MKRQFYSNKQNYLDKYCYICKRDLKAGTFSANFASASLSISLNRSTFSRRMCFVCVIRCLVDLLGQFDVTTHRWYCSSCHAPTNPDFGHNQTFTVETDTFGANNCTPSRHSSRAVAKFRPPNWVFRHISFCRVFGHMKLKHY